MFTPLCVLSAWKSGLHTKHISYMLLTSTSIIYKQKYFREIIYCDLHYFSASKWSGVRGGCGD